MRRTTLLFRMMCMTLTVMLLLCGTAVSSAEEAPAEEARTERECSFFDAIRSVWFYVPATVPDTVQVLEWSEPARFTDDNGIEFANSCSIEFAEGDIFLQDALSYRTYYTSFYDSNGMLQEDIPVMELYVDNSRLNMPGEAVFHVRLESEHYVDEEDVALHVLSWNEQPAVMPGEAQQTLYVGLGETIGSGSIADRVMDVREEEIIADFESRGIAIAPSPYRTLSIGLPQDTAVVSRTESSLEGGANKEEEIEALDYGNVYIGIRYDRGNIRYEDGTQIVVPGYRLIGPNTIAPGETAQYALANGSEYSGRTFSLSTEGEAVTLDQEAMTLTVAKDTPTGTAFTLTATPSDGGDPVTLKGTVSYGLIAEEAFENVEYREGFSVPVMSDEEKYETGFNSRVGSLICDTKDETAPVVTAVIYTVAGLNQFAEDPSIAERVYRQADTEGLQITADETVEIDGHPARIITGNTTETFPIGLLYYVRNNRVLIAQVRSYPATEDSTAELPQVTMNDMKAIAERILYDPEKASVTLEDGAVTITAKGGEKEATLSGGQTLLLTAVFANPDRVNRRAGNNSVLWAVTDPSTGEAPADVTVDDRGRVTAGKNLNEVRQVVVSVFSPYFQTSAEYPVTVVPSVSKIQADPEKIYLYLGTDTEQTVRAIVEPEKAPLTGLTWIVRKRGITEFTDNGDGTATFRPVGRGSTAVTVTESGGKKTKFMVCVVEPVKEVNLTVRGQSKPGNAMTVRAELLPKNVGNKQLEWSLDVGEEIATIDSDGVIRIAKTAPISTVMTVTCTALGAPEPVSATMQITVEE